MTNHPLYRYRDFMNDDFPFKMHVHRNELNRRVHSHEHLQICYLRKGTCSHYVNGKKAILVKGDIFSIPPFLEHINLPIENQELEMIQIDFMPFFINESMRDLSNMDSFVDFAYIQPFVSTEEESLPKLNMSLENQMKVESLITNMLDELSAKEEGYRLSIKADLLKLLIIVGREYKAFIHGKKDKQIIGTHRRGFYQTIDYIKENYMEEIKLDQMADMASISSTYYSYLFKILIGKTFIELLNETRIQEALKLLKKTDLSVTEVCLNVGFNHLGHFHKMFKKIVGVTPSQYRK